MCTEQYWSIYVAAKTLSSNEVETIFLTTQSDVVNYVSSISWTPYVGFQNGVNTYELFQIIDGELDDTPIASLDGNVLNYQYDLEQVEVRKNICYRVVATENINNYSFIDQAGSNDGCGSFTSQVYIPNAFSPNGFNKVFKPEFSFNDYLSFDMKIFNRWNKLVHQTTDGLTGWNGDLDNGNGEGQPGIYFYIITFRDKTDVETVYKGQLTLIR